MIEVNAEKTLNEIKTLEKEIELKKQEFEKIAGLGVENYSIETKQNLLDMVAYIDACVTRIEYIKSLIYSVEGAVNKTYLIHRFVLHKTQADIAEEMHYSETHTYRIAKRSLKAFEKVLKENT